MASTEEPQLKMAVDSPPSKKGKRPRGRPPNPALRKAKHMRMLNEAMQLFVDNGYDNVTVEQIARASGQSKGAFYWYFKDKEDCLRQIVEVKKEEYFQLVDERQNIDAPLKERILSYSNYSEWTQERFMRFIKLMFHLNYSREDSVRKLAETLANEMTRNGHKAIVSLGKKVVSESGWTDEQMKAFDFDTWALCYLGTFEGIFHIMQREAYTETPNRDRITKAIHNLLIRPLFSSDPPMNGS